MIDFDRSRIGRIGTDSMLPILDIDWDSWSGPRPGCPYPRIWLNIPYFDAEGAIVGRECVSIYPNDEIPDPDGSEAVSYGSEYFAEGEYYDDARRAKKRTECFRAAELFFLHASAKGNNLADLYLGDIYSYDLCCGNYWVDPPAQGEQDAQDTAYPRERRAFESYARAMSKPNIRAAYRLGDMYLDGIGCEADPDAAMEKYRQAFEIAKNTTTMVRGSVELRIGRCYENGIGCERDLEAALDWYTRAESRLHTEGDYDIAWYRDEFYQARDGALRCRQEIAGTY